MNIGDLLNKPSKQPIHDNDIMGIWEQALQQSGFQIKQNTDRKSLTNAHVWSSTVGASDTSGMGAHHLPPQHKIPIHIKVIGRQMKGSFRCHIGTGKVSRPIQSVELRDCMRLIAVFLRIEGSKHLVSPEFIFFPSWLLHLFRYTQHGDTPGRTDVRFLENETMAKEDHIYRLNHVINSLFRFHLHQLDHAKVRHAFSLAGFLFDRVGLDHDVLPFIPSSAQYCHLVYLLQDPRPLKTKPACKNCNTKPASRRCLCVACYRYKLKHQESRPLRLIVANRPGPRSSSSSSSRQHRHTDAMTTTPAYSSSSSAMIFFNTTPPKEKKICANCSVQDTHQWYRNLVGEGHWCETCKSYYLRHNRTRPPELFVKAAKRKVDVKTLVHHWSVSPSPTIESVSSEDSSSSPISLPIPLFAQPASITVPPWCL